MIQVVWTVSEIRIKFRKLRNSEDGLGLIVIHYLQIISITSKYTGQRVLGFSEISRYKKKLVIELCIPVIALAKLSSSVE